MTWDWLPWRRWQHAERMADAAEESLAEAQATHRYAQHLAAEALDLKESNGFTDAVRIAMGVRR